MSKIEHVVKDAKQSPLNSIIAYIEDWLDYFAQIFIIGKEKPGKAMGLFAVLDVPFMDPKGENISKVLEELSILRIRAGSFERFLTINGQGLNVEIIKKEVALVHSDLRSINVRLLLYKNSDSPIVKSISNLCKRMIALAEDLGNLAVKNELVEKELTDKATEIQAVLSEVSSLNTQYKLRLGLQPWQVHTQYLLPEGHDLKLRKAQSEKIFDAQKLLNEIKSRHEAEQKQKREIEESCEILERDRNKLDCEGNTTKHALGTLQNSIRALNALFEPIDCMNEKLLSLHNFTKEKLQSDLNSFKKYTENDENIVVDIQKSDCLRALIRKEVEQIRMHRYIVQDCSSTYVEIADICFRKPLSSLSQLAYISDDNEKLALLDKLESNMSETDRKIRGLLHERHTNFLMAIDAYQAQLSELISIQQYKPLK